MKSIDQANEVPKQMKTPCEDCPFRRKSIAGWPGGMTPGDYAALAHSDSVIKCHTKTLPSKEQMQCAGAAIYRKNVCKMARTPNLSLPGNTKDVFATVLEFLEHHTKKKLTIKIAQKLMFGGEEYDLKTE